MTIPTRACIVRLQRVYLTKYELHQEPPESSPNFDRRMDDSLETKKSQEGPFTPDSLISVEPGSLDPSSPDSDPSDSDTDNVTSSLEDEDP